MRLSRQCHSNEIRARVKTLDDLRNPYHRYVLRSVDVADLSCIPRCAFTSSLPFHSDPYEKTNGAQMSTSLPSFSVLYLTFDAYDLAW